jgi:hypothetical protein
MEGSRSLVVDHRVRVGDHRVRVGDHRVRVGDADWQQRRFAATHRMNVA